MDKNKEVTVWDEPRALLFFEEKRAEKRIRDCKKGGHLTFDCFHLKWRKDRAYCSEGIRLSDNSSDGTLSLQSVLKGTTASICRECKFFTGKSTEKAIIPED